MNLSDRDFLLALLNLVGSLAHKLTGEYPMLCLEDEEGDIHHWIPGIRDVQWFKDPTKATCCLHTEEWFRKHFAGENKTCTSGQEVPPTLLTEPQASGGVILS